MAPTAPMALVVTYFVEPGLPAPLGNFEVLIDGASVARYTPDQSASGFYDVRYDVPPALTTGKDTVTIRFQAGGTGRIVPVFAVRTIRR